VVDAPNCTRATVGLRPVDGTAHPVPHENQLLLPCGRKALAILSDPVEKGPGLEPLDLAIRQAVCAAEVLVSAVRVREASYSAENRSASTNEIFEMPDPRRTKFERSEFVGRAALRTRETQGRRAENVPRPIRVVALVGDDQRVLLQAASR